MLQLSLEGMRFPWDQMDHWQWWIFGVLLLILDVITPVVFFVWLAIAAAVVGFLLWFAPETGWEAQWLAFAGCALLLLAGWRLTLRKTAVARPLPTRNGLRHLEQTFTLTTPIENGSGKIQVDGENWEVIGPDAPQGAQVRVIGLEGNLLLVELPPPHG